MGGGGNPLCPCFQTRATGMASPRKGADMELKLTEGVDMENPKGWGTPQKELLRMVVWIPCESVD